MDRLYSCCRKTLFLSMARKQYYLLLFTLALPIWFVQNLLRYQLSPLSSPAFSWPLKFSLDWLGGLLNEVPSTLPRGRIWANLINLGSPMSTIASSSLRLMTHSV